MRLDSLSRLLPLLCLMAVPLLLIASSPRAEDRLITPNASPIPRSAAAPSAQGDPVPARSLPPQAVLDRDEVTILRDNYAGQYKDATLANLSQLYWRLGAFDLSDDLALGNYVKINDCRVFTDFVNDDMEWAQIINVMREHIASNRESFSLDFQFILQLHLGRYDPQRGGFDIVNRTGFVDTKRIEVDSLDSNREVCFDRRGAPEYPTRIVILLPRAFTLDFIEMDEHVAQAYILRKQSEYSQLDESRRLNRYERDAYLRLRVNFSQYHGNMLQGSSRRLASILYGHIVGYDVFEDSTQKRLMVSVDFDDESAALMTFPQTEPAAGRSGNVRTTAPRITAGPRPSPGGFASTARAPQPGATISQPVSYSLAP